MLAGIAGAHAGHWTHETGTTGVTAVLFPGGARGGYALPGHAPGSRELAVLAPGHLAEVIHGICLSGGSAFGLAAADGVMAALAERDIGLPVGGHRVPLVPAAILFDLPVAAVRPGAAEGRLAAEAALAGSAPLAEGRVGAGAGAQIGKIFGNIQPGGFGTATQVLDEVDWRIWAGVAVNAIGGVRDPSSGAWVAGGPLSASSPGSGEVGQNTTLGVVVTDAPLSKVQCGVVARMAIAGMARAIEPVFTPFDGDILFVASTGEPGAPLDAAAVCRAGWAAAECVARAIVGAVSATR